LFQVQGIQVIVSEATTGRRIEEGKSEPYTLHFYLNMYWKQNMML